MRLAARLLVTIVIVDVEFECVVVPTLYQRINDKTVNYISNASDFNIICKGQF